MAFLEFKNSNRKWVKTRFEKTNFFLWILFCLTLKSKNSLKVQKHVFARFFILGLPRGPFEVFVKKIGYFGSEINEVGGGVTIVG